MDRVDFSQAFLRSDITCLVVPGSPIRSIADADQTGVRIAVPRGDGSLAGPDKVRDTRILGRLGEGCLHAGFCRSGECNSQHDSLK